MRTFTVLFFLLAFTAINAVAQINITSTYSPVIGDRFAYSSVDTNNVQPGSSGANQNWSFTFINVASDSTVLNYVSPNSTPYAASFPSATVAQYQQSASSYTYFSSSATQLINHGVGNSSSVVVNSNPQVVMQFPFTYNSNFSDNFQAQFTTSGITTYRRGTISVNGDAYGTISLPTGTFSNALRVKTVQTIVDSTVIGTFSNITTSVITTYSWYNGANKFPLFQITNSTITTIGGTVYGKLVTLSKSQTVDITKISTEVPHDFTLKQNYPNPFNPSTKISFSIPKESFTRLIIYDNLGREVSTLVNERLNTGLYEVNFNAANLNSGIYYYKISAGNFSSVKKMTLVK